jgi:hypothetical protein
MPRTLVEIYLPWTFIDEGTYTVSMDKISAKVSIKYFPSHNRFAEVTGLSVATGLDPDDSSGIIHFSSIMIEFPFLLHDLTEGFDFDSSNSHSPSYYDTLFELCLRYLNRLVYVVRFCTGRYWIKLISPDSLHVHGIIEENKEGGEGKSFIRVPTGRPFEWNIKNQPDVQVKIDELLKSESRIPISENLFLEALNYYYHSDLPQAIITANTSLEVLVMDDMINSYIKRGKSREEAIGLIAKLYKRRFESRFKRYYFNTSDVSSDPILKKVSAVRETRKQVVHPILRIPTPDEAMKVLLDVQEIKLWIESKGSKVSSASAIQK